MKTYIIIITKVILFYLYFACEDLNNGPYSVRALYNNALYKDTLKGKRKDSERYTSTSFFSFSVFVLLFLELFAVKINLLTVLRDWNEFIN